MTATAEKFKSARTLARKYLQREAEKTARLDCVSFQTAWDRITSRCLPKDSLKQLERRILFLIATGKLPETVLSASPKLAKRIGIK